MYYNISGSDSTQSCVWNAGSQVRRRLATGRTVIFWLSILLVLGVCNNLLAAEGQADDYISSSLIASPPQAKTPFELSKIIEKAGHLVQRDISNPDHYWAEDSRYHVEFTPESVTYYQKQNSRISVQHSLRFLFGAIRVSDKLILPSIPASVRVEENRLTYQRTPVIKEFYEVRGDGVEQSWIIERPLTENSGDLIIYGKLLTQLSPKANKEGGVDFLDKEGNYVTTYGKVVVIDNAGNRLAISPLYKDTGLTITIPGDWLSQATYPVVVDPLIGSNIQVDNLTATDNYPAIAFDGTNYLIVWQSGAPNATGTGTTAIKGVRVSSAGTVLDAIPLSIGDTANYDDEFPSVAYDSVNTRYIVVWMRWNSTTSADIFRNTVTTTGTVGTVTNIIAGGTSILAYPMVSCCDVNNNYYVVYGTSATGITNFTAYSGQTYNRTTHAAAVTSNPTATVSSGTITPDTEPRSAAKLYSLSTIKYLMTWETFGVDANGDVSANLLTVSTTPAYTWGTEVSVAAAAATLERYPRAAFDGTNAFIVYQQGAATAADVYGRFVTPGAANLTLGTTYVVSAVAGSGQTYPDVAYITGSCSANPVNRYMIVWQDYRNNVTNPDIYGSTMTTAGVVETAVAVSTDTTYIKQLPSIAADNGNCGYMVAWSDYRNNVTTSSDIYTQRVGYPNISNLSPTSQSQGNTVSINGMNFGADPGAGNRSTATNNVKLGVTQVADADILAWVETPSPRIDFRVPAISPGTYQVTVTAGSWTSNSSSLTVTSSLQITTTSLPVGYQWLSYSGVTLAASGGVPPYSNWQVVFGALPAGLTRDPNTGVISGTPTGVEALETVSFTVQVTDSVSSTATKDLSITTYKLTGITVTDISGTPVNPTININNTFQFKARGTYSDLSQYDISGISPLQWKSSNSTVATIGLTTGLATGSGAGTVTICAVTEAEACP